MRRYDFFFLFFFFFYSRLTIYITKTSYRYSTLLFAISAKNTLLFFDAFTHSDTLGFPNFELLFGDMLHCFVMKKIRYDIHYKLSLFASSFLLF